LATVTLVGAMRDQALYGMDASGAGLRVVTLGTDGSSQQLAPLAAPYTRSFGPSASHTTNEVLVSGFAPSTGLSQIQRISPTGLVTPVFTPAEPPAGGDTIDPLAIAYRSDGWAYFAMSDGQETLSLLDPQGDISNIGGPSGPGANEGFGPTAIAPSGLDVVYSGPWSFDLSKGQSFGSANLVARFQEPRTNEAFVWPGFSFPRLAAPNGDLHILDPATGDLFRFVDVDGDGDHFDIIDLTAQDDPDERVSVGQLDPGFVTLTLDPMTQDMIATRIVGNVPQRITVMAIRNLNGDGDLEDAGEKTILFDAGAPAGTDIRAVKLKY
jgi:hypothetical protein